MFPINIFRTLWICYCEYAETFKNWQTFLDLKLQGNYAPESQSYFALRQKHGLFGFEILNPEENDKSSKRQKLASTQACFTRVWSFSPFQNSSLNICLSSKTSQVLIFKTFISMPWNTPQTIVILSQEQSQHEKPAQGERQRTGYQGPVRDCGLLQELGNYFKHSYFVFLKWEQEWKELSAKGSSGVCGTGQNQKILTFASVRLQGYQPIEQRSLFMYFLMLWCLNC